MGMMSNYDMQFMEEVVREIVYDWNTTIYTYIPLPVVEQEMNELMREVVGNKLKYNRASLVAERKYITNNYDDNIKPDKFGDRNEGTVLYSVPSVIEDLPYKPNKDDLFTIDDTGDVYRLRMCRDRIGEVLITLYKYQGFTIDNIIIVEDVVINEHIG